jgi:hypothetical protein
MGPVTAPSRMARRTAATGAGLASLCISLGAAAQPLENNRFTLDLFQGPILAPIGVMGMAGAYAAYAEGLTGFVSNAAAPAVREPHSFRQFEWDVSGSVSLPIRLFRNDDFDNSGSRDYDYSNFVYITAGAQLQYGPFGFGLNAEFQRYSLTSALGRTTNVTVGKYHVLAAWSLLRHQLVVGAGARLATFGLDAPDVDLTIAGAGPEVGFLIRPDWQSFRIGATFRAPVDGGALFGSTVDKNGIERTGNLIVPEHVVLPWELQVGVAVQVGPRPLNPAWIDPSAHEAALEAQMRARRAARARERGAELAAIADPAARAARARELDRVEAARLERDKLDEERTRKALENERRSRYWNWPREHLLFTADILFTGAVDHGVSIQGFLGQNDERTSNASIVGSSGAKVAFSPRLGVETEPIPGWVHTRAGSYYEPSRFTGRPVGRQHFTFGADVRTFSTTWFGLVSEVIYKLQASADFSPRYQSVSLGLGVWH